MRKFVPTSKMKQSSKVKKYKKIEMKIVDIFSYKGYEEKLVEKKGKLQCIVTGKQIGRAHV